MNSIRRLSLMFTLAGAFVLSGCPTDPVVPAGDTGTGDAGMVADTGPPRDTGPTRDTGAVDGGGSDGGGTDGGGAVCGDGAIDDAETCDDGNTAAADGCDATCETEEGYECTGEPSTCAAVCGDGLVVGTETCDDGNTAVGDGCKPSCSPEDGYSCTGEPSTCVVVCGDGTRAGTETCDDGNTTEADGCDALCVVEAGWSCASGLPNVCTAICGDGLSVGPEAGATGCDDGNRDPTDGCDTMCVVEMGFSCAGEPSVCMPGCGDGLIRATEACDDSDVDSGDGCSSACQVEIGFTCTGEPSACETTCGDGTAGGAEACDDNNLTNGDGCSATCQIEAGFVCSGATCTPICGDTMTVGAEECDDGNAMTETCAYGATSCVVCAADCTIDPGATSLCGDMAVDAVALETCDDGNTITEACPHGTTSCSVCDSACHTQAGAVCGDGAIDALHETCDDGNMLAGDGCALCVVTAGYVCTGAPSTCTTVCGDGVTVTPPEACDDGNLANNDGCEASCTVTPSFEVEPNGTSGAATPLTPGVLHRGRLNPSGDLDFWSFTLTATSDVRVETFDAGGVACAVVDTIVQLRAADGTTILDTDDDNGAGNCSLIDPSAALYAGARTLAPGTYYVRVHHYTTGTGGYSLRVTATAAACGNGTSGANEACDDGGRVAGDGCSATCTVEAGYSCAGTTPSVCTSTCGNGVVNIGESCDDGARVGGDGCSANCNAEAGYLCPSGAACARYEVNCNDGVDSDGDGAIDSADSDCALPAYFPACGAGQSLRVFLASGAPRAVPDNNATGITVSTQTSGTGTIARAAVVYSITHTWDEDLDIRLITPSSGTLDLSSDNGGSGDNYTSTVLDSTCAASVATGTAPFSGCFLPEGSLAALNGTTLGGMFMLGLVDDTMSDTGTITRAALVTCVTP